MKTERQLLIEYSEILQKALIVVTLIGYQDDMICINKIIKDCKKEIIEIDFKEFESKKDRPDPNPEPSS